MARRTKKSGTALVSDGKQGFITSFFGLSDDKIFDPENGIDLSKSTVVLDTWCTNYTMSNYATSDWPSIPVTIAAVPLHHSFFRVYLALGDKVWKGRQEHVAPEDQRDWQVAPVNTDQGEIDEKHWTAPERMPWVCDRGSCGRRFRTQKCMLRHQKFGHDQYRPFACDEDGCNFSARVQQHVDINKATVHRGEKSFQCDICGETFGQPTARDTHVRTMHSDAAARACDVCGEVVPNSRALVNHKNRAHPDPTWNYV
ncbi:transcription factor [Fusarium langsethiae]|uniref:Transcription factor n=1 Tax=Fusarium langsethiae TaxID=179993 RepID=A0A0M9ETP7_FUSLA|nr:transcription factor [Fusarium langsethiae]GKU08441.1 unnamed protein product [Fusarium langsethiae]GKU21242.1 unnamed protein product [Fusarium langsethiae]